jgi:hypothetical protein
MLMALPAVTSSSNHSSPPTLVSQAASRTPLEEEIVAGDWPPFVNLWTKICHPNMMLLRLLSACGSPGTYSGGEDKKQTDNYERQFRWANH